jgi:DNA-binding NarL/FixJ family response regulator
MEIVIADDHALFRESLRSLLEARSLDVVGEAENGREAVELAWKHKPDVVLMDLSMPEVDGLAATKQLAAELPDIKVVILTASDDDANLFEAIKAGAKGYLLKDLEAQEFFALLEGVDRGEPALTPSLARKLLDEFARAKGAETYSPDALTDREQEVLELMVKGVTTNRNL